MSNMFVDVGVMKNIVTTCIKTTLYNKLLNLTKAIIISPGAQGA